MSIPFISQRPEDFDRPVLERLSDEVLESSWMVPTERYFLNGLVRLYQPKNILEIGVAAGGGTCILLNAVQDRPEAKVTSIDLSRAPDLAHMALRHHSGEERWTLYPGTDPADIIEKLKGPFDLVVLDTAHIHPIESLNFLSVLPFLSPEAIVVLHDINLHVIVPTTQAFPKRNFACKLLFETIKADKIRPAISEAYPITNIGAFQLTSETAKNLPDLFSMLNFPWGLRPDNLTTIDGLIQRHYPAELHGLFQQAIMANRYFQWLDNGLRFDDELSAKLKGRLEALTGKDRFILYGGGAKARLVLDIFKQSGMRMPDQIWDIQAGSLQAIDGIEVLPPDFQSLTDQSAGLLISLGRLDQAASVSARLKEIPFDNFMGLECISALIAQNRFSGPSLLNPKIDIFGLFRQSLFFLKN